MFRSSTDTTKLRARLLKSEPHDVIECTAEELRALTVELSIEAAAAEIAKPRPHVKGYEALREILREAYDQAAHGKGKDRHAGADLQFTDQPIFTITRAVGLGFPAGQAMKKIIEAGGMATRGEIVAARRELLGAIVYTAALILQLPPQNPAAEA